MPGINLSQSAQKKEVEKYNTFGRGLASVVGVLGLALAVWGGLVFYEKRLSEEVANIQSTIEENRRHLSGDEVNKVADFQNRLDLIAKNLDGQTLPAEMLRSMEGVILPGIVLTRYEFDSDASSLSVDGSADSFRTVAQQMVLMKRLPDFQSLSVKNVTRADAGGVEFEFLLALSK